MGDYNRTDLLEQLMIMPLVNLSWEESLGMTITSLRFEERLLR